VSHHSYLNALNLQISFSRYQNNPKVMNLLKKFAGAAGGGGFPGMGMGGMGGGGFPGIYFIHSTTFAISQSIISKGMGGMGGGFPGFGGASAGAGFPGADTPKPESKPKPQEFDDGLD
jgi:hypothetical protein